jgi:small subunit ribosomal protein S1
MPGDKKKMFMDFEEKTSVSNDSGISPDVLEGTEKDPAEITETGELFASAEGLSDVVEGKVVRGKVLKIMDSEVLVDIGQKSEGSLPRSELLGLDGTLTVAPGDVVDVQIVSYDEDEGTFTVSHKQAAHLMVWQQIENAFRDQSNIRGRVIDRTKGGLIVDVGVRAFLPGSQADLRPIRNPDVLIGQEIDCKVLKLNKLRNNLVLSRRAALQEEMDQKKARLLELLCEGAELTGRVKNVTDYGAFVDLGGMDGLLHVTDLTWGRVAHASEVVQPGQEVRVRVLKYDPEKGRISLGLKQLTADPWIRVATNYDSGQKVKGRVVSVTDYGAFVELEPGIEGLVHISEMAWSRRLKHPSKVVKIGDEVEVVVLEIHEDQRRISLSLKQTLPDPWTTLNERYSIGMVAEGRVRNLTDFGAFIELEDGVDALIHISDLSWNKNIKHPSEILRKGQRVQGQILNLDPVKRRISLGLKQLQPDIWEEFFAKVQVGGCLRGKVVRIAQFGVFVELQEGIEGLCHNSEIDGDHIPTGATPLAVGGEYDFHVLRLDPAEKRIGLSLKPPAAASSPTEETSKRAGTASAATSSVGRGQQ